jgi:hypothetical protein
MSVGDLNTSGDKKNNFTWQFAVLELLGQIAGGTGGPGTTKTPGISRASAPGALVAGFKSVSFFNAGAIAGTVQGVSLKPGEQITYSVINPVDVLTFIAYDATGTDFLITTLI